MAYDIVQIAHQTEQSSTSSTTVTLAGCTPGNLLVMLGYIGNSNAPAITWPSGFTEQPAVGSAGEGRLAMAYRTCPASPPSTWQADHTSFSNTFCLIELPAGSFNTDAFQRTVNGNNVTGPPVTPTAGKDAILLIGGVWLPGYGFSDGPSGYTNIFEDFISNVSARVYILKKLVNPTSGTYDPGTYHAGGGVQASTLQAAYVADPPRGRNQAIVI